MIETTVITTPSGHKVTIKNGLTYGESRQIQRMLAGAMTIDPKTQESHLDGAALYDSQDLALKLLVTQIDTKDGQTITEADQILAMVFTWPGGDGEFLYNRINEMTTPKPQKKGA